jgi:hypothetical protein
MPQQSEDPSFRSSIALLLKGAVAVVSLLILTGCATIINGRSQSVAFDSTPTGADLTVGGLKATTPAKLTLTRNQPYTATFTKADFPERKFEIEPGPSWWLLGNAVFGGLIGIIVDLATGSGMTLSPSDFNVDLATGQRTAIKEPDAPRLPPPTASGPRPAAGATNFGRK